MPSSPTAIPQDCTAAKPTVPKRVYWLSFLRPLSPSFFSASKLGETAVSS